MADYTTDSYVRQAYQKLFTAEPRASPWFVEPGMLERWLDLALVVPNTAALLD